MNLERLLGSACTEHKITGSTNIRLTGIADDSRKVKKGNLFVAISGLTVDAHKFIPEAIKGGAVVIVGEKDPSALKIGKTTYIQVPNSRKALGFLASAWFGHPSKKMKIIGVTGTDGKTTTVTLLHAILKAAGKKVGSISSISAQIENRSCDTGFHVTSPEQLPLQRFLAKMAKEGTEYAILEVTSHGLDQGRFAGVEFYAGVLTNISHEHLDYHKTFEAYRTAKAKLFKKVKIAVLNQNDESFEFMKRQLPKGARLFTYERSEALKSPLVGEFNKYNVWAAATTAKALGITSTAIQKGLQSVKQIPGRLEKVESHKSFDIYIDFAHTPNSLENALRSLSRRKKKCARLICVFGCAGERDKQKRPLMGEISARLADISIFTAEDPRSEDVNRIIDQIVSGANKTNAPEVQPNKLNPPSEKHVFTREPERGKAIKLAIDVAKKGDIVAICGKGHEKSMAYDHKEYPWSDREAVELALEGKIKKIKK